jgi:Beta xylosidase C-terminal Concanavalin A-like domain
MNWLYAVLLLVSPLPISAATMTQTPAVTMVRAYLGTPASVNTLVAGSTLQFTAYAVYSDGSVAALPDGKGNAVTAWTCTSTQVGSISSGGIFTAVGPGTTNVWAKIGTLTASPWGMTVTNGPLISGPTSQGSPIEDVFLGPFWKLVSPVGGWASMSNDHLLLNVPGGSNHDTLAPVNQAVRVMQAISNYNFDVSIKIDSTLVATNQGTKEGLMVTSDASHSVTFEVAADGTNIHLSAETIASGSATVLLDITNFGQYQSPMYLRLSRAGSAYVAYYSTDGSNWIRATNFTYTRMPTSIGLFGSNYNASPAAANPVAMSVDWFHAQ